MARTCPQRAPGRPAPPRSAQDARATGELLEILRCGDLPSAAATCLAAAAAELDPCKQAGLLRAACYGAAFCALDPAAARGGGGVAGALGDKAGRRAAADVAHRLRLLNALRQPGAGGREGL